MGQQPNIPLTIEDLPRAEPHPGPSRRWRAARPGDLTSPGAVPQGGAFGTPGPDTGYALLLLGESPPALPPGERRGPAEQAMAALMAARASRLGRAPVAADAEVASLILGYREARPAPALAPVRRRVAGEGEEGRRRLLEAVDQDALVASVQEVRRRAAAGEQMIG